MDYRRGKRASAWPFAAFLLLAGILHLIGNAVIASDYYINALIFCAYTAIYFGLVLLWMISVNERLLPCRAKRHMIAAAGFMLFFLVLRVTRYRIAPLGSRMSRYCWYAYYLPTVMIPTLFLMSSASFVRGDVRRQGPDERLLLIPAVLIVAGVLSNDIHHMALLPLTEDMRVFGDYGTYTHGLLYYAVFAWAGLCMAAGVYLLFRASRRLHSWRKIVWPLLFLVAMPLLILLRSVLPISPYEVPEIEVFCMLGVFEACIRNRLVPHNENYAGFFASMSVPAMIADPSFKPAFQTASPLAASEKQLEAALAAPVYLDSDTPLKGMAIRAGYAFWTEDERELHRMNERFQEVNETLALENDLIRNENELRVQKARLDSRNRLYGQIAGRLYPTQRRIEALLEQTAPGAPDFRRTIAVCCVMNAYVKRRSNLMLLAAKDGAVDNRELLLALEESARYLKYCGVEAAAIGSADTRFPLAALCELYDAFEALIEALLPHLRRLTVSMAEEGLKLMADSDAMPALPDTGLPIEMTRAEDTLHITIRVREGGAA